MHLFALNSSADVIDDPCQDFGYHVMDPFTEEIQILQKILIRNHHYNAWKTFNFVTYLDQGIHQRTATFFTGDKGLEVKHLTLNSS